MQAVRKDERAPDPETRQLLSLAGEVVEIDFDNYLDAPLERRIDHRMTTTGCRTRGEYLSLVERDSLERARLADALLIKTTEMFRDGFAFQTLRALLPAFLASRPSASEAFRAWVPACATGEEAFSIAICLLDAVEEVGDRRSVSVLATDVDVGALSRGAKGIVSGEEVRSLDEYTLVRWLQPVAGGYRLDPRALSAIRFAKHDLLDERDAAPREAVLASFDLVVCRNLLVYLEDDARARVCSRLVAACEPGSMLMLGTAEVPSGPALERLTLLDRAARLYRVHG